MKYKKRVEKLNERQRWWDQQSSSYQKANKRPGSVKVR